VGKTAGPACAEVIQVDPDTGIMYVRLASQVLRNEPSDRSAAGILRNEPSECLASEKLRNEPSDRSAAGILRNEPSGSLTSQKLRNEPSRYLQPILRNKPNLANPMRVISCRRANYAWAWTLGEGVET
jgi:hypothetical protein